ncbi:hypothetical protein GEV39_20950 [Pseudomonas sp. NY5710]|nr:hypothetical protein GEV39_20950 [Pseudomonas sp. NY5710]
MYGGGEAEQGVTCGAILAHSHCTAFEYSAGPVAAGMPGKNPTRWLAPAAPVFAGAPAPTGYAVRLPASTTSRSGGPHQYRHLHPVDHLRTDRWVQQPPQP